MVDFLNTWLAYPDIYRQLLGMCTDRLPSDRTLKYELIKLGFTDKGADQCLKYFLSSVDFAGYFEFTQGQSEHKGTEEKEYSDTPDTVQTIETSLNESQGTDKIPIRLTGGRKAWLVIPHPFYEDDKKAIKSFVDVILADEKV